MSDRRIGIYSTGLWRLRDRVAHLTGMTPVRAAWRPWGLAAIAGWGHKPTADRARAAARRRRIAYHAIEDGFFRSMAPGGAEKSLSHICDAEGVYYDARGPSALERFARLRAGDPTAAARAAGPALAAMRELRLSKYNAVARDAAALAALDSAGGAAVAVIDQTRNDAAVTGAGADRAQFAEMLIAAVRENPGAPIILKAHPETLTGRREGYLDAALVGEVSQRCAEVADARRAGLLRLMADPVAPMDLFERVARVYVVSSLMGFEALVAGRRVTCFGQAFYAGWGLTDDRAPDTGRRGAIPLDCLAAAAFIDYSTYFDPETDAPCSLEEAIGFLVERKAAASDMLRRGAQDHNAMSRLAGGAVI